YVEAALAKVRNFAHDVEAMVDPALNTPLPIVDKSLNGFLSDPDYGINFDLFGKLQTVVTNISNFTTTDGIAQRVRNVIGLSQNQFNISIENGYTLSLNFNFDFHPDLIHVPLHLGGPNLNFDQSVTLGLAL